MTKSNLSSIEYRGTEQMEKELREFIEKHKNTEGPLMPVLQYAQDLFGYLPIEVQTIISEELDVPMGKIYGVVTFYSQFSLYPKGKYKVSVCLGTACYVKGAGEILDRVKYLLNLDHGQCTPDGLFSLDATRCLGCCGLAPVMTINDDVYGRLKVDDVDRILDSYRNKADK